MFWCLQPAKPGLESNIIRLLFRAENLGVYETDAIDEYEIEANVQRSLLERERVAETYAKADEEAAQYAEDRNRKIEEMRRNNQL
jgi:L-fucose isomerase-like protein